MTPTAVPAYRKRSSRLSRGGSMERTRPASGSTFGSPRLSDRFGTAAHIGQPADEMPSLPMKIIQIGFQPAIQFGQTYQSGNTGFTEQKRKQRAGEKNSVYGAQKHGSCHTPIDGSGGGILYTLFSDTLYFGIGSLRLNSITYRLLTINESYKSLFGSSSLCPRTI